MTHGLIIIKLHALKLDLNVLKLILDYLTGWEQ